jgi:FAD/FMN-containing dehydrogenase
MELVTADGRLVRADADHHPDLFWALRGGGGNFGVVTAIEFEAHPVDDIYAGALFFEFERSSEVLHAWNELLPTFPDELMSWASVMHFPPIPDVPAFARGRSFAIVSGAFLGEEREGRELLRPIRDLGPAVDTFAMVPPAALGDLAMDPADPLPFVSATALLSELSSAGVEDLVSAAGPGSGSPLAMVELRQLGGALSRPPADLNPMGRSDSGFIMYGLGATPTPEVAQAVQAYLAYVAEAVRPHASGATYVNFMDLDGASAERVRAAYSPDDWQRLVTLKDRYDPTNLFRFNRNIPPSSAATSAVKRDKDSPVGEAGR